MRANLCWALALLLGLVALSIAEENGAGGSAAADPDGSDLDLDEDDFDDDDDESEDSSGGMGAGQGEPVEDFDLDMPEDQRKLRMRSCLSHTMARAQAYQEQLQGAIAQMVEQQQVSQEQAANSVIFSWMITCYMNIDDDGIKAATAATPLQPEQEEDVFSHHPERGQQANQASQRQWQLLEAILMEQNAASEQQQRRQGVDPRMDPRAAGTPAGQSQMLYVLVVFGIIFGLGAIVVVRLMRSESQDRDSKSQRKTDKAEKKLARKQK